ncbi:hypothetical protein OV203_15910 [Nannocystis sp. ILAH1]|uniref:hypothetical protein n=1 Tax=unclassified Nannocystis TaxID=2627009 RepID=UPI002270C732|nr:MULTISPECIES: hypothetical protein [unclassified Nannocystis]MCY0988619.1 hypothetical protein [Nannocystis sp. ILAH1]MCY1067416.1 hypothetical protein [Nannocystis sp. RBIL2]
MSTTSPSAAPAPPPVAEPVWETDWARFFRALALWTLIPSAVLAPVLQYVTSPQLDGIGGLVRAFVASVQVLGFATGLCLALILAVSSSTALLRVCYTFEASEHGVALRDDQGKPLGDTADGSLRVTNINVATTKSMVGGLRLEHRGGSFLVLPKQFVAPSPGMTATSGTLTTRTVSNAMYDRLLRHAA